MNNHQNFNHDNDLNAGNPDDQRILRVINKLAYRRMLMAAWDAESDMKSGPKHLASTVARRCMAGGIAAAAAVAGMGFTAAGAVAGAVGNISSGFRRSGRPQPAIDELIAAGRLDEALRIIDSRIARLVAVGAPSGSDAKDAIYELVWQRIKALSRKGDVAGACEHLKTFIEIEGSHRREALQLYNHLTGLSDCYWP